MTAKAGKPEQLPLEFRHEAASGRDDLVISDPVSAAASIIDRSGGAADVGVPRIALATLEVPSYTEEQCPMCLNGERPVKPGSRSV